MCECRKPKPGMFFLAENKYNIDMKNSWMIGDSEKDIQAANASNITNTILVRSGHKINENLSQAKFLIDSLKDIKGVVKN